MGMTASKPGKSGVYETSWLRTLEGDDAHPLDVSVARPSGETLVSTGDQSRQVPAAASETDCVINPAESGHKAGNLVIGSDEAAC